MAGPKVFVPGPGARPNIGSPAQYLSNIASLANSRRVARANEDKLAQQKIFQDASLALNERKQDFTEAAPQRAEDLRLANLARESEKVGLVQNMAEGLQYSGGDRFTTLDDDLLKDPRYAALDDAGKLAARNQYIQNNPSALTDPTKFGGDLRKSLQATGKFTGAEIDAAVTSEIGRRYPTADPAIIKSLLAKPEFKIGSGGRSGTGTGSTRGGSFGLVSDPTNPKARGEVVDRITETYDLSAKPFTVPLQGSRIDFGNLDPAKTDINQAVGMLSAAGVNSPTAQEAAFALAFDEGGTTIKPGFDWRTPEGRQKLIDAGLQSQGTEERIFNKRGGGISRSGEAAGNSPAAVVQAAQKYNAGLLSSLTPKALSDAEVVSTFLDSLGQAPAQAPATNTTRQGGDGGGTPTPEVVDAPIIAPAAAAQPEAEFNIGGQLPIETAIEDATTQALSPANLARGIPLIGPAVEGVQEAVDLGGPFVRDLIQSLTPAGPGVLDPRGNTPATPAVRDDSVLSRAVSLNQARALEKNGTIKPKGKGDKALLDAYFKYLEGQRN